MRQPQTGISIEYIPMIYTTFEESNPMKVLSLKLDDDIYEETEKMTADMRMARNRYINDAVKLYNLFNRRRLLKKQLERESRLTRADSMETLDAYERLMDEP
jgi:predicted transcriptional regulator